MSAMPQDLAPQAEPLQCYNRASVSSAQGRHDEALRWYERAIALKPDFIEAHNNRGLVLAGMGRHREAIKSFMRALEIRPGYVRALNNLGMSLAAVGDATAALACFDAALATQPDYLPAIANRAELHHELGHHALALAGYQLAQRLKPHAWKILLGLGRTHRAIGNEAMAAEWFERAAQQLNRAAADGVTADAALSVAYAEALQGAGRAAEAIRHLEDAVAAGERAELLAALGLALGQDAEATRAALLFDRALLLDAVNVSALRGLAVLRQRAGDAEAAIALYERAIASQPARAAELHWRKANLLQQLKRDEEAVVHFVAAMSQRAAYQEALMGCSVSLAALRRHGEALACLDELLKIDARNAQAMSNRGAVLAEMGDYLEAIEWYERALVIEPHAYGALCNRGVAAMELHQTQSSQHAQLAIDSFRRAREVAVTENRAPAEIAAVEARLLGACAAACDWSQYDALRTSTMDNLRGGTGLSSPYAAIAYADDPSLQRAVAERYGSDHHPALAPALAPTHRAKHERIRVAYLSADFYQHATAYLVAGLFERHDRTRFEITAVSFGRDDGSEWRQRIRDSAERFIDAATLGDAQVAALLAELQIDIAVDLKGYTQGCRTGILARRPAPVQVSYLGFPGTMGVPYIDYILADGELVPMGDEVHYTEKVVRLPYCYQVNDDRRSMPAASRSRAAYGLPESAVVLGSFNASYKVTPETFSLWMRILARAPDAVLWQLQRDPLVCDNLRREAVRHGVDPQRLLFAEPLPIGEHLSRMGCADLILDTLPINAHTTASDALWAGVPILTQRGRSFAARVCSSLLHAMNLPELVVGSAQAYEDLAVALAADPARLAALRARVAAARTTSPLFDTARSCRHIEAAYAAMWRRHQSGHAPDHITVHPIHSS